MEEATRSMIRGWPGPPGSPRLPQAPGLLELGMVGEPDLVLQLAPASGQDASLHAQNIEIALMHNNVDIGAHF